MFKSHGKGEKTCRTHLLPGSSLKRAERLGSQCLAQDLSAYLGKHDERILFPKTEENQELDRLGETWGFEGSGANKSRPQKGYFSFVPLARCVSLLNSSWDKKPA